MIEQIKKALQAAGIAEYTINETRTESVECFFIRRKLDLKRRAELCEYAVTVFWPFEKDGKRMLGSSLARIHPEMTQTEMEAVLASACHAASFVANPWYELPSGTQQPHLPSLSTLAGHSLEENMKAMVEALFAGDTNQDVFLNSAEIFV